MRLKIGQISMICFAAPVGDLSALLPLPAQEIRLLAALVDEKFAELQELLLTC
ncbi:hypothetical protein D3C75_1136140 [compost metagenome]